MTHDGPPSRHLHPVEPPFDPDYDTPPAGPQHADRAAEHALLATLLDTPTTAGPLTDILRADDFHWPEHARIWDTWHHLNHDTPPDHITLNAALLEAHDAHAIRALADITTTPPNPTHAEHYAAIIRDHARLRTITNTAAQLNQLARNGRPDNIDSTLAEALQTLDDTVTRIGTTHTTGPSPWAPLDLNAVLQGQEVDPPPELLARDDHALLLYTGAVHTLSGEPGSGKTWITLIAALQELAQGNTVTMIDFEDRASRVVGRLLALGAHPDTIRQHFRYLRPHNAIDHTTRHDLDAATTGATLVILDGVTEAMTLHGLELEKNADIARFYDLLPRHIADQTGAAVVLIDHVVKDSEKQGRWGIGGQHKLAGIDGVAYLVRAIEPFGRGKTGHARLTVSKDRPGYVEEIALGRTVAELHLDATDVNCLRYRLEAPSALPTDQAGNMRPTHLMERVSKYVEITPGLGKNELADGRISGKREYIKRAIDRLVQEGYVEVATGTNRKQIHRSVTPFREDDQEALL